MNHPKGFIPIIVVVFIAVIAAGVVGAAWYYNEHKDEVVSDEATLATNTQQTNTSTSNADVQEYSSDAFGYAFEYPSTSVLLSAQNPAVGTTDVQLYNSQACYTEITNTTSGDAMPADCFTFYVKVYETSQSENALNSTGRSNISSADREVGGMSGIEHSFTQTTSTDVPYYSKIFLSEDGFLSSDEAQEYYVVLTLVYGSSVQSEAVEAYDDMLASFTTASSASSTQNTNTNTTEDMSALTPGCPTWQTYTDPEFSWTMEYPCDWTYTRIYNASGNDPFVTYPERYVKFVDPNGEYRLLVGLMPVGGNGSTIVRTGVGAGDFVAQGSITVAGTSVPVKHLVFENKVKEVFFHDSGSVTVDGYALTSTFDQDQDLVAYSAISLEGTTELEIGTMILESLQLP